VGRPFDRQTLEKGMTGAACFPTLPPSSVESRCAFRDHGEGPHPGGSRWLYFRAVKGTALAFGAAAALLSRLRPVRSWPTGCMPPYRLP